MSDKKPLLLFTCFGAHSHVFPTIQIAEEMIKRGYDVVFVVGPEFEAQVIRIGAEWVPTISAFELLTPEFHEEISRLEPNTAGFLYAHEHIFLKPIPQRAQVIQNSLESLRQREPGRQIIVLEEALSTAIYPFKLGRPPPKGFKEFPKTISFNIIPLFIKSRDTAPFLLGIPPDSSEAGRQRNEKVWKEIMATKYGEWVKIQTKYLKEAGATQFPDIPFDAWATTKDACFQMCIPSLEHPRSDMPSSVRFAGCAPKKLLDPSYQYPDWWPEVASNKGKKIIFVAQGTVAVNYQDLVIPTLVGLANREDFLVVASLGIRGAKLADDFQVPSNARVHDYLPYDTILELADVFVCNGGYGSLTHSVVNGVPQVLSGVTEDKVEVGIRAERAGLAFNLAAQAPTPEQIAKAVDVVLSDPKYKQAALALKEEDEGYDTFGIIENQILEFTRSSKL
ncbi:putative glycosyltransferase [Thozetella sp. PMI_491]|nr:putative glycosyltransferase [Thozetella sp. PMI_491]